jgi:hypothetical protein
LCSDQGPSPSTGTGEHRYIILLLDQVRPPPSSSVLTDYFTSVPRTSFDLGAFLGAVEGSMVPAAINLFYVDSNPATPKFDWTDSKSTGARGLGAAWKARPAERDEL